MEKEEILFALLKDEVVQGTKHLRTKYPNINVTQLRSQIINYQIEKYGHTLYFNAKNPDTSSKDINDIKNRNARQRNYDYRKNHEIEKIYYVYN